MDSRCMSSFIVGPARFPLERNRKRMEYADRSYQFVRDHVAAAQRAVEKKAFPHGRPDGAIRSNNPDAPELLLRKISDRRRAHLLMKAANAAIRSAAADDKEAMVQAVVDATGWRESRCREIVCPRETWMGRGFTSDAIAGELAEIKRLEKRLATIMENRARGMIEHSHDTDAGLVRVIENGAAARIQLFFAGKPEQAVRKLLKGNGFRWAPSEGAWQRHLNEAGRYAALRVIASLHKS